MQKPSKFITNTLNVFKMKMLSKFFGLVLLVSLITFWACQKSENSQPANVVVENANTSKIAVKDGVLHFADYAELAKTYEYLRDHQDELGAFAAKIEGFQSFNSKFESIDGSKFTKLEDLNPYLKVAFWNKEQGDPTLDRLLDSRIYSELFNHEGLLIMGNEAIKIGADRKWYIFNVEYLSEIDNLAKILNVKILDPTVQSGAREVSCSTMFCYNGAYGERVNGYKSAEYTLVTDNGVNTLVFTGNTAISTKSYSRGIFGIWYLSRANTLSIGNFNTGVNLITTPNVKELFFVSTTLSPFTTKHTCVENCGTAFCTN